MKATSSAIPRPSAPTLSAPAVSPLDEALANPGEADLRAGPGWWSRRWDPLLRRPGPQPRGGVAAVAAGPEAASLAPLRAVWCGAGAPGGRGAAGPWSSERSPGVGGGGTADR